MRDTEIKMKKYQAELEDLEKELKTLPKGYLIKRGTYYAQRNDAEEIGITKKPDVIRQLCRKKYLLERKKQLDENLSIVMHHINKLEARPKEAIDTFSTAYHGLPTSHFFHPQ